jgi:hypothetical protein
MIEEEDADVKNILEKHITLLNKEEQNKKLLELIK